MYQNDKTRQRSRSSFITQLFNCEEHNKFRFKIYMYPVFKTILLILHGHQ